MRSNISLFLFFCMLLTSGECFAQKQANIWHFGLKKTLDFSSGSPVDLPGSKMFTFEGCASYCDKNGKFLFYTNGGGREPLFSGQDGGHIWNRNNEVMYDMRGIEGGGFSSAQSAVIFEAPGQDSVYCVFTMDEMEWSIGASDSTKAAQPGGRGLSYFTVDMRLNGGLGGVVIANKKVYSPSYEAICAVKHQNASDYWIIIHQDSSGLGCYKVTQSGVTLAEVYTDLGPTGNIIKASPNGKYVAINTNDGAIMLAFDNSTGKFSNPKNLAIQNNINAFEFSPNSRYFFTTESLPSGSQKTVVQYDLQASDIVGSARTVGSSGSALVSSLQLAPDGKIYALSVDFGGSNNSSLHRINCPNTSGANLELNVFTYEGQEDEYFFGLPNFPAWLFERYDSVIVDLGADSLALCKNASFVLDAKNQGSTYLWSTGATSQSITVNKAGTYSVTVTSPCGSATDQVVALECPDGKIIASDDTCVEKSIVFSIESLLLVEQIIGWNFGDPGSGAADSSKLGSPSHQFSAPGTYNVSCIVQFNCSAPPDPDNPITTPCFFIDTLYYTVTVIACDTLQSDCEIKLSNAFTPNGDGTNDYFAPATGCIFDSYSMLIHNRWGYVVFQSADPSEKWEGKQNGNDLPEGVYFYLISYRPANQPEKTEKGFVSLIR